MNSVIVRHVVPTLESQPIFQDLLNLQEWLEDLNQDNFTEVLRKILNSSFMQEERRLALLKSICMLSFLRIKSILLYFKLIREIGKIIEIDSYLSNLILKEPFFLDANFSEYFIKCFLEDTEGDYNVIKEFVKNKMEAAIENDNVDELQKLTSSPEFNFAKPQLSCGYIGEILTLLQYCAFYGSVKCFKFVLMNIQSIDNYDEHLKFCAQYAIASGETEIIRILEQNGVDYSLYKDSAIKYHRRDIFNWINDKFEPTVGFKNRSDDYIKCVKAAIKYYNIYGLLSFNDFPVDVSISCAVRHGFDELTRFITSYYTPSEVILKNVLYDMIISGNKDLLHHTINCIKHMTRCLEYALMIACDFNNFYFLNFLLLLFPDININTMQKFDHGTHFDLMCTPLILAVISESIECIKILLAHPKIDVNLTTDDNWPLEDALKNREILVMLLNHPNIDVNQELRVKKLDKIAQDSEKFHYTYPFIDVLIARDQELIEMFLSKKNLNINLYAHLYSEDRFIFRTSPALYLISSNQFDLARRLLDISADEVSNVGQFRLYSDYENDEYDIIETSCLNEAIKEGATDLFVDLIQKYHADPSVKLHNMIFGNNKSSFSLFYDEYEDDEPTYEDITCLHTVIEYANLEALKVLAAQPGFDINIPERKNSFYNHDTPSPVAYGIYKYLSNPHSDAKPLADILIYILETFPNVNLYSTYNFNNLISAAIKLKSKEIIELLIQRGYQLKKTDFVQKQMIKAGFDNEYTNNVVKRIRITPDS